MSPNIISIEIGRQSEEECEAAIIKIDGRDFIDIVTEVEQPIAKSTGEVSLTGEYWYLPLHIVKYPSELLLRGDIPSYLGSSDGKRSLLECNCGCPGCWPLKAKITVDQGYVKWSNFEQPHRQSWSYPDSFEFVFSLEQLQQATRL